MIDRYKQIKGETYTVRTPLGINPLLTPLCAAWRPRKNILAFILLVHWSPVAFSSEALPLHLQQLF